MTRLIAIDLPGGDGFVTAIRRAWDDGDAILPIDRRLPDAARGRLLADVRPHLLEGEDGREVLDRNAPPLEDGDALVIATSGSTGTPKAIVHTMAGLTAHARAVHERLDVDGSDRWLACLPLAHIGGLGVVIRSVLTDVGVTVSDGFDVETVRNAPDRFGSTLVSLVPTALDRIDAARFRWVVLGGSADVDERADNVVHTYGSTETGGGIVYGTEPLTGVELRVGESGGIGVRGTSIARGRRRSDGSVERIVDADGWFETGDLGALTVDEHGRPHLTVSGRRDDLIITGGQNVWPTPVEAVLRRFPGIVDVAVHGLPDPEWGRRVVASIVVDGAEPQLADVRAFVRDELPAYAAPRELRIVTELPRTALGKIRRRALDS